MISPSVCDNLPTELSVPHYGDAVAELAERLLRYTRALDDILGRYRRAVANANRPGNDDLPF
jgi:hypothetical protein